MGVGVGDRRLGGAWVLRSQPKEPVLNQRRPSRRPQTPHRPPTPSYAERRAQAAAAREAAAPPPPKHDVSAILPTARPDPVPAPADLAERAAAIGVEFEG